MISERDALRDVEDALDRYGADVSRWPTDVRARLAPWLSTSSAARELLADATRLEELLRDAAATPIDDLGRLPPELQARLANIPILHPRRPSGSWVWPFESFARPLFGLAAAAVLGLAVGGVMPNPESGAVAEELERSESEEEWYALAGLDQAATEESEEPSAWTE